MTITLGWWILPVLITFVAVFDIVGTLIKFNPYDFMAPARIMAIAFVCVVAWLIWSLL